MDISGVISRFRASDGGIVFECRHCGARIDGRMHPCRYCGSTDLARFDLG